MNSFESTQNIALISAAINLHILRCPEHNPETNKCDFLGALESLTLEQATKTQSRALRKWTKRVEALCEKYELTPLQLAASLDEIASVLGIIARGNIKASSAVLEALTSPVTKIGVKED